MSYEWSSWQFGGKDKNQTDFQQLYRRGFKNNRLSSLENRFSNKFHLVTTSEEVGRPNMSLGENIRQHNSVGLKEVF